MKFLNFSKIHQPPFQSLYNDIKEILKDSKDVKLKQKILNRIKKDLSSEKTSIKLYHIFSERRIKEEDDLRYILENNHQ